MPNSGKQPGVAPVGAANSFYYSPSPDFHKWKVPNLLIVDSDIDSVQQLQSVAHQVNCDTLFAITAQDALAICETDDSKDRLALDKIDLLLIELELPDMSGIKLAGCLKRPFILTVNGDVADSMDAVLTVCRSVEQLTMLNTLTKPLVDDAIEIALLAGINFIEEYLKQEIRFRTRIDSCLKIEKAKGILQERYRINSEQAESYLRQASMNSRQRLYRVAETICSKAELTYRGSDPLYSCLEQYFGKAL